MTPRRVLLALLLLSGCSWPSAGPGCTTATPPVALPEAIPESSGLAISVRHDGLFWTVNDSGAPILYGVGADGALRARIPLRLAVPVRDWEGLEVVPCEARNRDWAGSCLYVGDVGDNPLARDTLWVHRLLEPDTVAGAPVEAESFPLLLPDGPRDIEALYVLPGERLFLVTKGRRHPVTVYRAPGPLPADGAVTLERVQELSDGPRSLPRQVTGASASPDGRVVVLRTYEELIFHAVQGDRLVPVDGGRVSLRSLREAQGEAVALGPDGSVVLSSEAGPLGGRGTLATLRCAAPAETLPTGG